MLCWPLVGTRPSLDDQVDSNDNHKLPTLLMIEMMVTIITLNWWINAILNG